MRKIIGAVLVTLSLILCTFTSAPSALADGSGTCSLIGGVVKFNVKETPTEGSVKYVSIASPVELATGTGGSQVDIYFEYNDSYATGRWIYSSPIDGDGYWNYRADFNWVETGSVTRIGRAFFDIEKKNSTNQCGSSVYI